MPSTLSTVDPETAASTAMSDAAGFLRIRSAKGMEVSKADVDDAANWAKLLQLGRKMSDQLPKGQSFSQILDEIRR